MCPDRRGARRTAFTRFEVALQSALQEKYSFTMTVRGLLGGGSVMVHRMTLFACSMLIKHVGSTRWVNTLSIDMCALNAG